MDDMSVDTLRQYLRKHWSRIKVDLLEGRYAPNTLRDLEISYQRAWPMVGLRSLPHQPRLSKAIL